MEKGDRVRLRKDVQAGDLDFDKKAEGVITSMNPNYSSWADLVEVEFFGERFVVGVEKLEIIEEENKMTKREELIEQYTIRVEEPEGLKVKSTEYPPLFTGTQYKANELMEYAQSIEELDDDIVYIIDHNDNVFNLDAINLRLAAEGYFKEDTMVRIVCTSSGLCIESARIKI